MNTPITPESIRQTVAEARKAGKDLEILGYRNQKGDVANYVVQFLHPIHGYDSLIEQSFHKLAQMKRERKCTPFHFNLPPAAVTLDVLEEYVEEKLQSWNTRMTTPSDQRQSRRQTAGLIAHTDGYFYKAGEADVVIIVNLRCVNKTHSTADMSMPETWGKSAVKERIDKALPIGSYIGQMNLTPGNIVGLRVSG